MDPSRKDLRVTAAVCGIGNRRSPQITLLPSPLNLSPPCYIEALEAFGVLREIFFLIFCIFLIQLFELHVNLFLNLMRGCEEFSTNGFSTLKLFLKDLRH